MKKSVIILIIVLFFSVFAALTKPSESHFRNYIKNKFTYKSNDNLLTKGLKSVFKVQSGMYVKYDDKIFYSLGSTRVGNQEVRFIGIFGFWTEL